MTLKPSDYDPRMGVFDKTRDVVRGQRVVIPLNLAAGASEGPLSKQPITVLDQQMPYPGAWDIFLSPITFAAGASVWPMSASLQPTTLLSVGSFQLQYNLHFGSGGTSFHTVGFWPVMGTTFTLATDVIRLDVQVTGDSGTVQPNSAPVVAAWATPSQSNKALVTDVIAIPLPDANVRPVPLGAKWCTVKTNASNNLSLIFGSISGTIVGNQIPFTSANGAGDFYPPLRVPVPGNARVWTISGGIGGETASAVFECELG